MVVAAAIWIVFSSTKGAHLELKGSVIKVRTGALDDNDSVAVLDFRVENPSDIPFVVREVWVTLEPASGEKVRGSIVSKADLGRVFEYNKFLGVQYNEALSLQDGIKPHGRIDRMVAASFPVPVASLDGGKTIDLWIQDLDGTEFDTVFKIKH